MKLKYGVKSHFFICFSLNIDLYHNEYLIRIKSKTIQYNQLFWGGGLKFTEYLKIAPPKP